MTRYIDPDLQDCLRREDAYVEYGIEITAPDVGAILRRAADQFFTSPPLVAGSQTGGAMAEAPNGGLEISPTPAILASATGTNAGVFDLNTEDPSQRMKGVLWSVGSQFARARLRNFKATIQKDLLKGTKNDFSLQIYRITKTPGVMENFNTQQNAYFSTAFTDYAFTPLLSTPAVIKDRDIAYNGSNIATLNFDLSGYALTAENTPVPPSAADAVNELPAYLFVLSGIGLGDVTGRFHWLTDTSGVKNLGDTIGTFQRSWWGRGSGYTGPLSGEQWVPSNFADCPSFEVDIDTYAASAQATYLIDLGRVPTAGTTGRVVMERQLPTGTSTTLELSTAGSSGPWTSVKNGDLVTPAQQQYWLRLTVGADAARRSSAVVSGFGVEFRTPYDVSDIAGLTLPTRDVSLPDCKASIAQGSVRLIREGQRDYLDLATALGSSTSPPKLEVDVFLRSRHPVVYGDRSKWLRLERMSVEDRDPGKTSETFTLLSITKRLKVKVPAKVETVSTVHTVTSSTATAVHVTPGLVGTSGGGHEYNSLGYVMRIRTTSSGLPAGYTQTIAGSTGTDELDFNAGDLPNALSVGDVIEVHSNVLATEPLEWQNADPADVWYDILVAAGFPEDRIGSADLPRSGFPPRATDFAPSDATTQGNRLVSMKLTDPESADELLDQISFILGGATVERNGQVCFVQIYPGRGLDGTVTVPVAPIAAVFDARDIVTGTLRTKPMVASRKATVTATYGVNNAAANPDAYPTRITNATDADAVEWLTQQDLELVGSMDLDDKITRWFYNTNDAGLYLASTVCAQVVFACSTGIRNFPFQTREPWPEVQIGDSAVVITDQYTDYDPALGVALAGTLALRGVIVHCGPGNRDFALFVQGLSESVKQVTGGAAGDPSATDRAPGAPTVQLTFDANGHPVVSVQGAQGTVSVKVAVGTGTAPSDAAVRATAAINSDQTSFTVTGITCAAGVQAFAKAFAYSQRDGAGAESIAGAISATCGGGASTPPAPSPPIAEITPQDASDETAQTITFAALPGVNGGSSSFDYTITQRTGATSVVLLSGSATANALPQTLTIQRHPRFDRVLDLAVTDHVTGLVAQVARYTLAAISAFQDNSGDLLRDAPYSDGYHAAASSSSDGFDLTPGTVDSNGRTVSGMFHKGIDRFGDIADDTTVGGFYKTNQNQRDGGGRGYAGLDGSGRLQTSVLDSATIAGRRAGLTSRTQYSSVLVEDFSASDPSSLWEIVNELSGSAWSVAPNASSTRGPNLLGATNYVALTLREAIPFAPNKLYRIRVPFEQLGGDAPTYIGVLQRDYQGNATNTNSGAGYIISEGTNYNGQGWKELTTWIRGASQPSGTTTLGTGGSPKAPIALNAGTVSIIPYMLLNYNVNAGQQTFVDYFEITEYDEDGQSRTYGALDGTANLQPGVQQANGASMRRPASGRQSFTSLQHGASLPAFDGGAFSNPVSIRLFGAASYEPASVWSTSDPGGTGTFGSLPPLATRQVPEVQIVNQTAATGTVRARLRQLGVPTNQSDAFGSTPVTSVGGETDATSTHAPAADDTYVATFDYSIHASGGLNASSVSMVVALDYWTGAAWSTLATQTITASDPGSRSGGTGLSSASGTGATIVGAVTGRTSASLFRLTIQSVTATGGAPTVSLTGRTLAYTTSGSDQYANAAPSGSGINLQADLIGAS